MLQNNTHHTTLVTHTLGEFLHYITMNINKVKPFQRSKKLEALQSLNVKLANCEIKEYSYDQAGIFATNEITVLAPLITIPLDFVLTRQTVLEYATDKANKSAQEYDFFHDFLFRKADGTVINDDYTGDFPLSDKDILARFLVFQILKCRRGDEKDNWMTWVESLPPLGDMNLPFSWNQEGGDDDGDSIEQLYGSSIYEATRSKLEFLKYRYNKFFQDKELRKSIADFVKSGPAPTINTESNVEVSFNEWVLVESWICSRSLQVLEAPAPPGTKDDEYSLRTGLVPVIDMCNHSDNEANAKYELDPTTGNVMLIPVKPIKKNDQICINYGQDKGAGEMLYTYGFISDRKDAKVATFVVPPVVDEDEEEEGEDGQQKNKEPEDDDEATMVLRAKSKMFGHRPRLFKTFENKDGKVSWESDFVMLLALPASEFSFEKKQESKPDSGPAPTNTVLFRNKPLDFDNVLKSVQWAIDQDEELKEVVEYNSNSMAETLVNQVFLQGLSERIEKKEKVHILVKLEKELLEKIKF